MAHKSSAASQHTTIKQQRQHLWIFFPSKWTVHLFHQISDKKTNRFNISPCHLSCAQITVTDKTCLKAKQWMRPWDGTTFFAFTGAPSFSDDSRSQSYETRLLNECSGSSSEPFSPRSYVSKLTWFNDSWNGSMPLEPMNPKSLALCIKQFNSSTCSPQVCQNRKHWWIAMRITITAAVLLLLTSFCRSPYHFSPPSPFLSHPSIDQLGSLWSIVSSDSWVQDKNMPPKNL